MIKEMSTFKVLLISVICGIVLFGFVAFLSIAFHIEVMVSIVALICMPTLAISAGHVRKDSGESKLWTALAVSGVVAPLTWLTVVLIFLIRSDI